MLHVPPSSSALPTTTWRFRPLLLSLLLLLLLYPYVEGRRLVLEGLMAAVLLAGLYSVSRQTRLLWLSCLLGLSTFLAKALSLVTANQHIQDLHQRQATLQRENQDLVNTIAQEESPTYIIVHARAMGLVPANPEAVQILVVKHLRTIPRDDLGLQP